MICIFVILLIGWCRTRMRRARVVSNAFLYITCFHEHQTCPEENYNFYLAFLSPKQHTFFIEASVIFFSRKSFVAFLCMLTRVWSAKPIDFGSNGNLF